MTNFPSEALCGKPLVHQGRSRSERDICQGSYILETRDDVLIQGLWNRQTDTIIDVKLNNAVTDTYKFDPMVALPV